jgi:battenin
MYKLNTYKNSKLGFLIAGLTNNYNFIVVFSCAYALSQNKKFINPALLILAEIIPGFITQLLYPQILYKIPYLYRYIILYVIQILSSLFLIINPENLFLLFSSVILVSINSYLGESSMLSLSSYYDKKELRFWSIGTGLASLFGTGLFLVLNLWWSQRAIFILNLFIYLIGMTTGLYLIDFRNKIKQIQELKQSNEENILKSVKVHDISKQDRLDKLIKEAEFEQPVPIENFDLELESVELEEKQKIEDKQEITDTVGKNEKNLPKWKKHLYFFMEIYPIILAYFFAYLFAFGYVPSLVMNNLHYQITQFITRTSLFFGRTIGNYLNIESVGLFGLLHMYNLIILTIFTILITSQVPVNFIMVNFLFVSGYFINGISYPIVYQHIYKEYSENKEWYMGAVGQYTSFFTILGCAIGYPLQLVWKS